MVAFLATSCSLSPVQRACSIHQAGRDVWYYITSHRPEIEPGTFWLAVRDLTNCANLVHTDSVVNLIYMWHIRRSLVRGWGNLFTFGRGLDRIKGPCMWDIITVWLCPILPRGGVVGVYIDRCISGMFLPLVIIFRSGETTN